MLHRSFLERLLFDVLADFLIVVICWLNNERSERSRFSLCDVGMVPAVRSRCPSYADLLRWIEMRLAADCWLDAVVAEPSDRSDQSTIGAIAASFAVMKVFTQL